jgi:ribosomal protein L37E
MSKPFVDPEETRLGYHFTSGGLRQWSPCSRRRADKTQWQTCHCCGRLVPAVEDWLSQSGGAVRRAGTWTYVCPYCNHCHVGTPDWGNADVRNQKKCHECGTELSDAYQCPKCGFPRGWMRVDCPYCDHRQPVNVPHWVEGCDTFRLECVQCESIFDSFCIC